MHERRHGDLDLGGNLMGKSKFESFSQCASFAWHSEPGSPRSVLAADTLEWNAQGICPLLDTAQRVAASLTLLMQTTIQSNRATYTSASHVDSVHIKIPWLEPEELHADTIPRLRRHVETASQGRYQFLGCSIRRGCVELTVDLARVDVASACRPATRQHHRGSQSWSWQSASRAPGAVPKQSQGGDTTTDMASALSGDDHDTHSCCNGEHGHVLDDLQPQDWVHWLYLQPPRDAEVLVQACGRAFVTSWNEATEQWTTRELPTGMGPDGRPLPPVLPKFTGCSPLCVALPHSPDASLGGGLMMLTPDEGELARSRSITPAHSTPGSSTPATLGPMLVKLWGPKLDRPDVRITARFHGRSVPLEIMGMEAGQPDSGETNKGEHPVTSCGTHEDVCTLSVAVSGVDQPGLLLLECWYGQMLTSRKQVAVLNDHLVAEEIEYHYLTAGAGPCCSSCGASTAGDDDDKEEAGEGSGEGEEGAKTPLAQAWAMQQQGRGSDRCAEDLVADLGCWVEFMSATRQTRSILSVFGHTEAPPTAAKAAALDSGGAGGSAPDPGRPRNLSISRRGSHRTVARTPSSLSTAQGDPCMTTARSSLHTLSLPSTEASEPSPPQLSSQLLRACTHPNYQAQMREVGIQLLLHSCSCAWHDTAAMMLEDLLELGVSFSHLKSSPTAGGMTLLHRAVCSGCQRMIQDVVRWGNELGDPWNWSEADPVSGITPLHVAAVVPSGGTASGACGGSRPGHHHHYHDTEGGESQGGAAGDSEGNGTQQGTLADWILQEYEAAWQFWHGAADATGSTPADIAEAHAGACGGRALASNTPASEGFLAAFVAAAASGLMASAASSQVDAHAHDGDPDGASEDDAQTPCSTSTQGAGFGSEMVAVFTSEQGQGYAPLTGIAAADAVAAATPMGQFAQDLDQGRVKAGLGLGLPGGAKAQGDRPSNGSAASGRSQLVGMQAGDRSSVASASTPRLSFAGEGGSQDSPSLGMVALLQERGSRVAAAAEAAAAGAASAGGRSTAAWSITGGGLLDFEAELLSSLGGGAPDMGLHEEDTRSVEALFATFGDFDLASPLASARASAVPSPRAPLSPRCVSSVDLQIRSPQYTQTPAHELPDAAVGATGCESRGGASSASGYEQQGHDPDSAGSDNVAVSEPASEASTTEICQKLLGEVTGSCSLSDARGGRDGCEGDEACGPPTPTAAHLLPVLWTIASILRATLLFFPSPQAEAKYCAWLTAYNMPVARRLPLVVVAALAGLIATEVMAVGWAQGLLASIPLMLFMAPWGVLAVVHRRLPPHHPLHSGVLGEPTWIMVVVWGVAVRSFMAAGLLPVPQVLSSLLPSGAGLMLWLVPEVLMQVRLPNILLPRCLTVLASTALFLRLGLSRSPVHALATTSFLNMAATLVCAALDLRNRCTYVLRHAALHQRHQAQHRSRASGLASQASGP